MIGKAKVEAIKEFLQEYINAVQQGRVSNSRLLILKGPSGCGKYITLKVLCDELGISINEWHQGDSYEPGSGGLSGDLFKFLRRSHACGRLTMRGDGGGSAHSAYNISIVKDFPFSLLKDESWKQNYNRSAEEETIAGQFRNILQGIAQPPTSTGARAPIIFFFNDSWDDTCIINSHFVKLLGSPGAQQIELNSVADTFITKALNRILLKKMLKSVVFPSNFAPTIHFLLQFRSKIMILY